MHRPGLVLMCAACATVAIAQAAQQPQQSASQPKPGATATAQLKDAKGQRVGDVKLRETPNGVLLQLELESLEPGVKAFHIHDAGRCDAPTFQTAGPHFNPAKAPHGLVAHREPHAGDLPNVHVPETGNASIEILAPGVTLTSGDRALLDANGSAVVLHAKADDYSSDPAGNAGDRIACGIISK
jgi:superoxide dismutase, Cu-Zn family